MGSYAVPRGRIVKGWTVRLLPSSEQVTRFKRYDGARRFACNWPWDRSMRRSVTVLMKRSAIRQSGRITSFASAGTWSRPRLRPGGPSVRGRHTQTESPTR